MSLDQLYPSIAKSGTMGLRRWKRRFVERSPRFTNFRSTAYRTEYSSGGACPRPYALRVSIRIESPGSRVEVMAPGATVR